MLHCSEHGIPIARHASFHFTFSGKKPQLFDFYFGLQYLNVSVFELRTFTYTSRCS